MSKTIERNILINSSLARITSALLVTIIHETGHFITSLALGNKATLFHNRVETHGENLNFLNQLLIPMGGPVISLIQGVFCMMMYKKIQNGIASLVVLWLGISGLMAFFGYMMIAPLSTVGDTGKIFQLLELQMFWQITIALLALGFFTLLLLRFHKDFEQFVPESIQEGKLIRAKWARLLIIYPVLIGIVITTLMQFPIVVFLSILPSLMMPFMLFLVYGQMIMSKSVIIKEQNKNINKISFPLLILTVVTIIIFRLLVNGVTI